MWLILVFGLGLYVKAHEKFSKYLLIVYHFDLNSSMFRILILDLGFNWL